MPLVKDGADDGAASRRPGDNDRYYGSVESGQVERCTLLNELERCLKKYVGIKKKPLLNIQMRQKAQVAMWRVIGTYDTLLFPGTPEQSAL